MMYDRLGPSWYEQLEPFIISNEFDNIREFLIERSEKATVYPPAPVAYRAFKTCSFTNTKVVILGQDPYHDGSATGLSFSTTRKLTPSLLVILKVLSSELGINFFRSSDLTDWAQQGVLLLNTALSVEKGRPNSHKDIWIPFTDYVLKVLKEKKESLVWMLWGNQANAYANGIPNSHLVLSTIHPAATVYNRSLVFEPRFREANNYLDSRGLGMIEWIGFDNDLPF